MMSITNTVLQYISLPQTNYALQINGAWGTGKTYYVKNKLKTAIEDKRSGSGQNFKFCYISLNGFSSVEQIGEAVFFEIANTKNQLAVQGLKLLGKYGGGLAGIFANVEQSVSSITEDIIHKIKSNSTDDELTNIVLCFDDLERIDDSLSIKQVFGFINSNYIEHHHVKVIFVSNEQEIAEQENYMVIREKIIGKTLNFFQTESTILEDIVFNVYAEKEDFIAFFEKEKKNLLQVINFVFEEINLRTLRFVLDSFVILQSEVYLFCGDEKERHEISKTLFLNTLIVGNEYKKGNLSTVNQLSFLYGSSYFYYFSSNDNEDSEEDYAHKFLKKYHRLNDFIDQNVYYFSSVSNYIINGYVENENYKREITSLLEKRSREKLIRIGEENPIEILREFWMYDDVKVKHAQDEVLNRIKEDFYSANEYPYLYNLFLMFRNENLLITEEENVENVLEAGFTKALEKWKPTAELDFWEFNMNQPELKKIIDMLKQKKKEFDYRERKEKVSIWLKALIHDSVEPDMYKNIENEKDFIKILLELNFTKEFLDQSSGLIVEMTRFLYHKYLRIVNSYEFHSHEIPYIDQLINQIDDYLKDYNGDKIKKYNLYQFIEQLKKVKVHLGKGK